MCSSGGNAASAVLADVIGNHRPTANKLAASAEFAVRRRGQVATVIRLVTCRPCLEFASRRIGTITPLGAERDSLGHVRRQCWTLRILIATGDMATSRHIAGTAIKMDGRRWFGRDLGRRRLHEAQAKLGRDNYRDEPQTHEWHQTHVFKLIGLLPRVKFENPHQACMKTVPHRWSLLRCRFR